MKRLRRKLRARRGLTLVEMVAATAVLALLALMLHTGLLMAQNSYRQMTGESERQLLVSTLSDLLANELRYARDTITDGEKLTRYTSVNYGRNTTLTLNDQGQLEASGHLMLSAGAYGNGSYRIDDYSITYNKASGLFQVAFTVTGGGEGTNETMFSVRCLNGGEEGGT